MTPVSGYPMNSAYRANGYQSKFAWNSQDLCGNEVYGLHGNEYYGSWTDQYYLDSGFFNTWNLPGILTANGVYLASYIWSDLVAASFGGANDPNTSGSPFSGTVYVEDDRPWTLQAFSATSGVGLGIYADDQRWYVDHGEHDPL
jgi:hypothetical protein